MNFVRNALVPVLLGGIAGMIGARLGRDRSPTTIHEAHSHEGPTAVRSRRAYESPISRRVPLRLIPSQDARVARADHVTSAAREVAPEPSTRRSLPRLSNEEVTSEQRRTIQRLEESHFAEPPDPRWAFEAQRGLSATLTQATAEVGANIEATSCRSQTCIVSLQWPTYRAALTSMESVLHRVYEPNCARTMILPRPERPDDPYQGKVFFDCARSRREEQ